jgi:hypothetical protein
MAYKQHILIFSFVNGDFYKLFNGSDILVIMNRN